MTGVCLLALWALLLRTDRTDPLVNGKRLSTHLLLVFGPVRKERDTDVSREAIKALGTNCVPLLKGWITNELPPWRVKMGKRMWKWGVVSTALPPDDLRLIAVHAVDLLNTNGVPLLSDLAALSTNINTRLAETAAMILSWDLARLTHIPVESQKTIQPAVERAIHFLEAASISDPALKPRAGVLRKTRQRPWLLAMRLNTVEPDEQVSTLRLFSRRTEKFADMLPLLLEHLQSTNAMLAENAAICLRNYGAQAKSALPALEKAESHPDERVRVEAVKAKAMTKAQLEDPLLRR